MEKCLELYVQNQFSVWCFIFYRLLQQCNNKSLGSFILQAVDNIWKNPFPTIELNHHHLYLVKSAFKVQCPILPMSQITPVYSTHIFCLFVCLFVFFLFCFLFFVLFCLFFMALGCVWLFFEFCTVIFYINVHLCLICNLQRCFVELLKKLELTDTRPAIQTIWEWDPGIIILHYKI